MLIDSVASFARPSTSAENDPSVDRYMLWCQSLWLSCIQLPAQLLELLACSKESESTTSAGQRFMELKRLDAQAAPEKIASAVAGSFHAQAGFTMNRDVSLCSEGLRPKLTVSPTYCGERM